ncbi:hypothetical protein IJG20_01150 [Candidatus Saccharibacteria bacterium]|nr:hypothetical protein [Candidatus Saccharibacteria bacterium]
MLKKRAEVLDEYADILNIERPKSAHPKMSMEQRAKQFSPFSALGELEN